MSEHSSEPEETIVAAIDYPEGSEIPAGPVPIPVRNSGRLAVANHGHDPLANLAQEDAELAAAIKNSLRDGGINQFEEYRNSMRRSRRPNQLSQFAELQAGTHNSVNSRNGGARQAPNLSPAPFPGDELNMTDNPRFRPAAATAVNADVLNDEEIARQLHEQINGGGDRSSLNRVPIASTLTMYEEQQELLRKKTFSGAYFGRGREVKPYFIYSIIVICTFLMIIEIVVNKNREGKPFDDFNVNPLFGPTLDTLLFLGAKRTDLIVDEGDFWRLIMPIFLHGGVLHLIFNMLFLYSFGTGLEAEFGHWKVAYIFLLAGFFGILFSAIFNPTIPSVGASGACYGLIGAAWADFGLNFGYYKHTHWKSWLAQLTIGTILNLALGLIPTLDNFAHIGGLIAGLFAGLSVLTLPRYDHLEELKPDHCYQVFLKTVSIFVVPVAVVVALIVLYVGVDVDQYCPWCQYLSCVPTQWWSCEVQCEEGFTIQFINSGPESGSAVITCPRDIGDITVPPPLPELEGDTQAQLQFCREHCLNQ